MSAALAAARPRTACQARSRPILETVQRCRAGLAAGNGADRLRRQPVHRRLLHGRGRRLEGFRRDPHDGACAAGAVRPADRRPGRQHGRLPVGPGRGRGADPDAVRQLGRRALAAAVPAARDRTDAADRRRAARAASRDPDHRLPAPGRRRRRRLCGDDRGQRASRWTPAPTLRWPRRWSRRSIATQGNLDPLALVAGGAALEREALHVLDAVRGRPHIFNLGHGIVPQTPPEHVAELVRLVRGA